MATEIDSPPYRNRHTFPDLTTTSTQIAIVGGDFPQTIGQVDVGDVSVGEVSTSTAGSYNYRDRYDFDEEDFTP